LVVTSSVAVIACWEAAAVHRRCSRTGSIVLRHALSTLHFEVGDVLGHPQDEDAAFSPDRFVAEIRHHNRLLDLSRRAGLPDEAYQFYRFLSLAGADTDLADIKRGDLGASARVWEIIYREAASAHREAGTEKAVDHRRIILAARKRLIQEDLWDMVHIPQATLAWLKE